MQSGTLKHRLQVEGITKVSDGLGGYQNTYITLFTTWGSVWGQKGETQLEGGRATSAITHKIRIRHRRHFRTSWRIKDLFSGKYYTVITNPIDVGDTHQFLEMSCKEVNV
jgi:SPP1 family predicted phage head-tail adaptor